MRTVKNINDRHMNISVSLPISTVQKLQSKGKPVSRTVSRILNKHFMTEKESGQNE